MQKAVFIFEEFFRSFRKSLFKDILLMIMLSAGLVMAVLMGSYYLELGQEYSDAIQYAGNGKWYGITIFNDMEEFSDSFVTAEGSIRMLEYYEALTHMGENPVYSVNTNQGMTVRESDFNKFFQGRSYSGFFNEDHRTSFMAYFGEPEKGGQAESVLGLKAAQIDFRAYQIFGMKTEEGEGFTKENMTIKTAADTIPIVLGNDYKGIFSVGDTLEVNLSGTDYIYPCKVAGILEKGLKIPFNGDASQDMMSVDSYLLFPYGIQISDKQADAKGAERYAYLAEMSLENAAVRIKNEDGFVPLANKFQEMGKEYGLPPIQLLGVSPGLELFRKESAFRVRVILILTIVQIFFTFYGLFVTLYDKVQSNKKVYGIYLANGCSVGAVMLSYLLEIAVILLPAVCVCRFILLDGGLGIDADTGALLWVADCMAGIVFLIGAAFIAIIMRGINVERLIRQKD